MVKPIAVGNPELTIAIIVAMEMDVHIAMGCNFDSYGTFNCAKKKSRKKDI